MSTHRCVGWDPLTRSASEGPSKVWRLKDLADTGLSHEAFEAVVTDEQALRSELTRLARLEPRAIYIELSGGEYLHVGLGGPWGFVEHVVDEPWKAEIAVSRVPDTRPKPETAWFVCGGQGSEIPSQYLLPVAETIEVVIECFRLGAVASSWRWE